MIDVDRKTMLLALAYAGVQQLSKTERKAREIIANSTVQIYSAQYSDWYDYPYTLQMVQRASQTFRDKSYSYIIDSGFRDPDVTNEEVLESAVELNPDWVVPKDYPGEPDRTAESLREFIRLYDDYGDQFGGRPLIPIQPPYTQTYREYEYMLDQFSNFALGGLHYFTSSQYQIEAIESFVDLADPGHVHALGVGTSLEFVELLRNQPALVDSLDVSTPESAVKNNGVPDRTWIQREFEVPKGTNSTMLRGSLSWYVLLQLNYMLCGFANEENFPTLTDQTAIKEFVEDDGPKLDLAEPPQEPGRDHAGV